MDLDDQVYFYIWDEEDEEEEDGASSSDPVLRLFESYKVLPWMRATFLEYGEWNASAGLGVAEEDIWQRRSDMQVQFWGWGKLVVGGLCLSGAMNRSVYIYVLMRDRSVGMCIPSVAAIK